ncbi:MAG TPA: hypothetical protein VJH03_23115 [Blastocatellia bacterium]|nr:hypothetical protein [Blastocatellia bacterium]
MSLVANSIQLDPSKKYRLKRAVEILPLDSASAEPSFVVTTPEGRSFVVSERLKQIAQLFDGEHSLHDIAEILSEQHGAPVSHDQVQEIMSRYLQPNGLIEDAAAPPAPPQAAARKGKLPLDFVFRFPLISPRAAAPVVSRLTWLFQLPIAVAAIAAIFVTHVAFYQQWFATRPKISFVASEVIIFYLLALGTAVFHEFGHAAACRAYRCDHGAIGVCLYLIFPAFYVNLSRSWRLPGRQRAVIDLGGIYFQLLSTVPLFLYFLLTGSRYACATIYSVDLMVLFSLNPVLKFDGYWLLVDLSGVVNLQRRGFRVVKETVLWSLGLAREIPVLRQIAGRGRKLLLVTYSLISITFFASVILLLVTVFPAQVTRLAHASAELTRSLGKGAGETLVSMGRLLGSLIFFLFIYRLLSQTVFRLFQRRAKRGTS